MPCSNRKPTLTLSVHGICGGEGNSLPFIHLLDPRRNNCGSEVQITVRTGAGTVQRVLSGVQGRPTAIRGPDQGLKGDRSRRPLSGKAAPGSVGVEVWMLGPPILSLTFRSEDFPSQGSLEPRQASTVRGRAGSGSESHGSKSLCKGSDVMDILGGFRGRQAGSKTLHPSRVPDRKRAGRRRGERERVYNTPP